MAEAAFGRPSLAPMSRYRFALRPRWILSHLFVLVMLVAMIAAGFWQLDRLQQRRDRNAEIVARSERPAADVRDLGADAGYASTDAAARFEFRRVTATGTYLADDEVLAGQPSRGGDPGSWVLTPLRLDDGTIVAVNRGWIPNGGRYDSVPDQYRAPSGEVTVSGLVRRSEARGLIGRTDPAEGTLEVLARLDVVRLDQQVDGDLLPFYLQLQEQVPAVGDDDPVPMEPPELGEGPHLSYAIQWFTFSTLTVVVYALILRKKAADLERGDDLAVSGPPEPDPIPAP